MTRAYQLCARCGHARVTHQHYFGSEIPDTSWCMNRGCRCPAFRRPSVLDRIAQWLNNGQERRMA